METKICIKCGIIKKIDEFHYRKDSKKHRNDCKLCVSNSKKESYKSLKNNIEYKEKKKTYADKYRATHKKEMKAYSKKWKKEKKLTDPLFKLKKNLRNLIRDSFFQKGLKKNSKTSEILGCTFEYFKAYIESKWEPWMNWTNRGHWNGYPTKINVSWDIDHIIPLDKAKTKEEIVKLNHYTNLRPLCSYYNRHVKRNT